MLLMLMMLMMLLMMLMLLMLVVVLLMMLMLLLLLLLLLVEVVVMMVMVIQRFIPHIVVVAVVVAAVAAVVVVVVDVRARAVADALETLREDVSRPAGGHDAGGHDSGRHDAALDGHGRQILINRRCRVAVIAPAGGKLGRGRWNDVGAGVVGAGDVSGWPWGWRRGGRRR